jgi:hypothetical protein
MPNPLNEAQKIETVGIPERTFRWRTLGVILPIFVSGGFATMAWLGALAFGGYSVAMWFFE